MSAVPIKPLLATSIKAATRSTLLFLGFDHALIDFLARTAIGAAAVLAAIAVVGLSIPRRKMSALRSSNR